MSESADFIGAPPLLVAVLADFRAYSLHLVCDLDCDDSRLSRDMPICGSEKSRFSPPLQPEQYLAELKHRLLMYPCMVMYLEGPQDSCSTAHGRTGTPQSYTLTTIRASSRVGAETSS